LEKGFKETARSLEHYFRERKVNGRDGVREQKEEGNEEVQCEEDGQ
jgi:hypothetical protein